MAKMKDFSVSVKPDEVMYTNISTSKDGYNSARMVVKKGDNEYMSISYEWEGNSVPGFAMDLMGFMKNNNQEKSGVWQDRDEEYAAYEQGCATCDKHNKGKAKVCPDCGKKMEECSCDDKASEDE